MDWGLFCRRAIFFSIIAILVFDAFLAAFGTAGATISLQAFGMTGGWDIQWHERRLLMATFFTIGHIFGRIDR